MRFFAAVLTLFTGAALFTAAGVLADEKEFVRIVNAIYWAEGGAKTRHPYGVMIETNNPRQVCYNTVKHAHARYSASDYSFTFIEFLAQTYCPASVDPVGHANWVKNVTFFMHKN